MALVLSNCIWVLPIIVAVATGFVPAYNAYIKSLSTPAGMLSWLQTCSLHAVTRTTQEVCLIQLYFIDAFNSILCIIMFIHGCFFSIYFYSTIIRE